MYFFLSKEWYFFAISKGVLMASIYIAVNTCWDVIADPCQCVKFFVQFIDLSDT